MQRRRSDRRSSTWLRAAQYGAAVVGVGLIVFWLVAWVHASVNSRRDVARFEAAKTAVVTLSRTETPEARPVDTSMWSEERIVGYQESLFQDFDLPMAIVRIPRVDIEAPVLPGTDELTLNRGLGWIEGTAGPGSDGNFAVAGHRDGFFRGLKDIAIGDEIVVETLHGSSSYLVDSLAVVDPTDVFVLEPREVPTVTLVTCFPFYFVGSAPQRFIVHASPEDRPAARHRQASGEANKGSE